MDTKTYRISAILAEEASWLEGDMRETDAAKCYARINAAFAEKPKAKWITITFPIAETEELLSRANYYDDFASDEYRDNPFLRSLVEMYRRLIAADQKQTAA
jgi:hypothetical protein